MHADGSRDEIGELKPRCVGTLPCEHELHGNVEAFSDRLEFRTKFDIFPPPPAFDDYVRRAVLTATPQIVLDSLQAMAKRNVIRIARHG